VVHTYQNISFSHWQLFNTVSFPQFLIFLEVQDVVNIMEDKRSVVSKWVELYNNDLYRHALGKMPDTNLAEDMVQNTFLAALGSYENFKGDSSPKTWLMSILKNKIMDHYRLAYKRNELSIHSEVEMFDNNGSWISSEMPSEWSTEHLLDNPSFNQTLANCMSALPENWNNAIQMKYLNSNLTPEDVGISRTNYWKMLERARRQLRKCLDTNWFVANK